MAYFILANSTLV